MFKPEWDDTNSLSVIITISADGDENDEKLVTKKKDLSLCRYAFSSLLSNMSDYLLPQGHLVMFP